jgi:transcriptional regulator with XRE-family HTH domain
MARNEKADDPAMARVRELWERKQEQGWTQQKLGEAMGYPAESARKSVSQFLKSRDPQISMLRRFANAVGKRLSVIIQD